MSVNIHGKEYLTVAERINALRNEKPDWRIITHLVDNGNLVVMSATIQNEQGLTVATGYAEEERGSSNINRTSALENCETSAVGRALAFAGYQGTEIASADEVVNAMNQQVKKDCEKEFGDYMACVRDNFPSIMAIKEYLAAEDYALAFEAWRELGQDVQANLWKAPSKGGVFTTAERSLIQEKRAEYPNE